MTAKKTETRYDRFASEAGGLCAFWSFSHAFGREANFRRKDIARLERDLLTQDLQNL